jgi:hypothetical protein
MHRRALLTSLAASVATVAGCSATGDEGTPAGDVAANSTTRGTKSSNTTTGTETSGSLVSVVELETAPLTYAFGPTTMRTDDEANVAL